MFVVAFAIGSVLLGGLLIAARRFRADAGPGGREPRRLTAGRGAVGRVGAVLAGLAVAIFIFGVVMTGKARDASADDSAESLDINVVGQQWLWRFEYPSDREDIATVFSYNELVVPVDTTVDLAI